MERTDGRWFRLFAVSLFASTTLSGCWRDVVKVAKDWDESSTYGCCIDTKQFVCLNDSNACPGIVSKTYEGGYDQCSGPKPSCGGRRDDLFASLGVEASLRWRKPAASEVISDIGELSSSPFTVRQPGDSCLELCKDGITDANCLAVKLAQNQRSALRSFYTEVSTPSSTWSLPAERMRDIFDVDADPCSRSSLDVKEGLLTNSGELCSLRADVVDMTLDAAILVPALLKATWTRSNSSVKAEFADGVDRPALTFHRSTGGIHPINRQFGGSVRYVEANSRSMYVQAENGCVGVLF